MKYKVYETVVGQRYLGEFDAETENLACMMACESKSYVSHIDCEQTEDGLYSTGEFECKVISN